MLDFIRPLATVRKMLAFAAAVDRLSVGPAEKGRPGGWAPGASAPPPHGPIAFEWDARQLLPDVSKTHLPSGSITRIKANYFLPQEALVLGAALGGPLGYLVGKRLTRKRGLGG